VKNTPSPSMLIGHEGKYTPSSSVPDLAQKYILLLIMNYYRIFIYLFFKDLPMLIYGVVRQV
jgi:hypothetical protein